MKKYDVFLFDADNTLFDYDAAEKNALTIILALYGLPFNEELHEKYREINAAVWAAFGRGEMTKTQLQHIRFKRLFAHMGADDDVSAFNDGYLEELGKGSQLIEGAYEICKAITERGKTLYIITNAILKTQQNRIKHSAISPFISDSFISEVVGYEKPHIKFFEHVLAQIPPTKKENILVIGDNLYADIQGGINTGLDTCWCNFRRETNKTGITPKYEITGLGEMAGFV
ncbi:MAG: YjjG family noncanonical pyrimidine nucleotidase [Defluviitaleaceae bacterium]|nr:YjjG family noncanonical pyrimidine nucleotidase [Defluviitaleaceae bacterium]